VAALDAHVVADAFLQAAVAALDTLPGEAAYLLGAPDRQYVCAGTPVIDCEQVVVWIGQIGEVATTPSDPQLQVGQRGNLGRVNIVFLTVMVARCIPAASEQRSGRIVAPSQDALNNAGEQTNADAWVLWCGLNAARKEGWFNDTCSAVIMEPATPLNPGGQYGGWQVPLSVQLEGYPVVLGS
jgi:hypothetical protein